MPAIPAVVTAATTFGSAAIQKSAARKAARAGNAALDQVKGVDVGAVSEAARQADLQRYRDQFKYLREVDPAMAQTLESTNKSIAETAAGGDYAAQGAKTILQQLVESTSKVDPRDASIVDSMKTFAQKQLAAGGQLSPEAQAELVRAGLATSGASGFNPGSTAARQVVGKLLASESENLANARAQVAKDLFGFTQDVASSDAARRAGVASTATNIAGANQNRLMQLASLVDSRTPSIGLGGGDVAGLEVSNTNLANQVALQRAGVNAEAAKSIGEANANLLESLGGTVSGLNWADAASAFGKGKTGTLGSKALTALGSLFKKTG